MRHRQLLGLLALRAAIATTRAEPLALTAAVLAWIGSGLTLPYYGAEDFGLHAIAGPDGHKTGLLNLVHAVRYQPLAMTIFGAGLLLIATAAIMAAIAVWRSHVLPRTSGILFAAGFALFLPQFFSPAAVRIAHGILLAVGSIILAAALWTSAGRSRAATTTPARAARPPAAPRETGNRPARGSSARTATDRPAPSETRAPAPRYPSHTRATPYARASKVS